MKIRTDLNYYGTGINRYTVQEFNDKGEWINNKYATHNLRDAELFIQENL